MSFKKESKKRVWSTPSTSDRLRTLVPEGLNGSPNPTSKVCRCRNWVPGAHRPPGWTRVTPSKFQATPPHVSYDEGPEHCQALTALPGSWVPRLNADVVNQVDWHSEATQHRTGTTHSKGPKRKVHKRIHPQRKPPCTGNSSRSPQSLRCPAHPEGGLTPTLPTSFTLKVRPFRHSVLSSGKRDFPNFFSSFYFFLAVL